MDEEIKKLQEENEKLKKLNSFKSDVISISAHELRTSLGATKWLLKMCLDGDLGVLTPDQSKLLKKAFEGNDRMIGLVNEMLSINHTEEASLSYNPQPTNIITLIDSIVFDFVGESYKRGIELLFLKPDYTPKDIHVDQGKIRFVIQNLIENAIKYSNDGDRVLISLHEQFDTLTITVKDTGIGIKDEDKAKIFEKFFRSKNAKEKEEIGTGLGLYTSKNIIEKHGGTMVFESTEGQGTTFSITLPFESKL
ncbi:MAG: HAMP domain-containing histidine kinase [Candidatus Pacebacteria bacterium]|jgi:signal transduction histidine kinase|nr:HAMP domain-containing histidine kinase [Candidatus Paceibacterota bacterium]MBP9780643.1 HAMP domain-containing histidine kinase [Candidatus Paceibacterota bacterium]